MPLAKERPDFTISVSTRTSTPLILSFKLVVPPSMVTEGLPPSILKKAGCSEASRSTPEITLLSGTEAAAALSEVDNAAPDADKSVITRLWFLSSTVIL